MLRLYGTSASLLPFCRGKPKCHGSLQLLVDISPKPWEFVWCLSVPTTPVSFTCMLVLGCPRRTHVQSLTSRWHLPLTLRFDPWLESLGKTLIKIAINQSIKRSASSVVAAGDSGLLRSRLLTLLPKQRALEWLAASSVSRGYWYWKKWGWTGRKLSWLSVTSSQLQSKEAVEEHLYQCTEHSILQTEPFPERR